MIRARRLFSMTLLAALLLIAAACNDSGSSSNATTPSTLAPAKVDCKAKPTKSEVVLGAIMTVSAGQGSASASQKEAGLAPKKAIQAWAQWVNCQGGVNGHPVRVEVRNDELDTAKARAAAVELVEKQHVLALVGNNAPTTDSAFTDYVTQQGIPVIGGAPYNFAFGTNPLYFPASTTVLPLVYGHAQTARDLGNAKTMGVLWCVDVPACKQSVPVLRDDAKKAGIDFVFDRGVSITQPSYTAECVAAKQANTQALDLAGAGFFDRLRRDCRRQGYKPTWILSAGAWEPSLLGEPGDMVAVGNTSTFPWFLDVQQTKDFRSAMSAFGDGVALGPNAALEWTAGALFEAATKSLPDQPTSKDIIDGLHALPANTTLDGLIPTTTYPDGAPAKVEPCWFDVTLKAGKFAAPNGLKTTCQDSN
jgi:branched-chain amino acid transport system substrate-binding protein